MASVMTMFQSLVLVLVLLGASVQTVVANCDDKGDGSFDFFMLAIQWPPEYGKAYDYFTLHGLWPSRFGKTTANTYPCECSEEPFNEDEVKDLEGDMTTYWGSLIGHNSNTWFWTHEWSKHGTCSKMEQEDYFNSTLLARKRYDPLPALAAGGVVPSATSPYSADTIMDAFQASYGFKPMLGCRSHRGHQLLSEMGLCLNKTLGLDNCHSSVMRIHDEVNDCRSTKSIYFLPAETHNNLDAFVERIEAKL